VFVLGQESSQKTSRKKQQETPRFSLLPRHPAKPPRRTALPREQLLLQTLRSTPRSTQLLIRHWLMERELPRLLETSLLKLNLRSLLLLELAGKNHNAPFFHFICAYSNNCRV
jgi:hypothetical protein